MKRKYVSCALAAVMAASICLSGCGNENAATNQSTESSKATESKQAEKTEESKASEEQQAELEEKTIQMWLCGSKQQDSEKVWNAFNEMLQEYVPNTTVEFSIFDYSEYKEKFSQMLATGEGVDVAWAANWVTGSFQDLIVDESLMPLNDLLAEYGQDITEVLTPEIVEFHRKADGELYYLVSWQGLAGNMHGLCVTTELAELAGETWVEDTAAALDKYWNENGTVEDQQAVFDQTDKYLAAAKEAGKLGAGLDFVTYLGWYYGSNRAASLPSAQGVGVRNGDNTFTVEDIIANDYFKNFCRNMAAFYQKGYIRSDVASVDTNTLHQIQDGVIDENTFVLTMHDAFGNFREEDLTKKWGVDAKVIPVERTVSLANGEATTTVIPYCADEPERAMMVMNAIYSVPELYQTLCWGIEGEHWTDNGDGTVNYTGGGNGSDAVYGYDNWKIGSCINGLTTQTMVPGYYEDMRKIEADAYISPFKNFQFDRTGLEDVIVALQAVDTEYGKQVMYGYRDDWEDVLAKYISERKEAGVDKLIEAYQEQLNAYIAENNITSF